jgi:GTP cyclohydrolase II
MVSFTGALCKGVNIDTLFLDLRNKRLVFYIVQEEGIIVVPNYDDYEKLKSYDTSKCEPINEERAKEFDMKFVRIYNAMFEPYYLYNIYRLSSRKNKVYILEYYNAFTAENEYKVFKRFTDALAEIYD